MPPEWASGVISRMVPASRGCTSTGVRSIRILPERIRSTSRMSLMSRISRSQLRSAIVITRSACVGAVSTSVPSMPSEPRIEVSGVRSSWLTMERNSSFIRSTSRRCVTSRNTTTAPVMRSSLSTGVAVSSTGKVLPSVRR